MAFATRRWMMFALICNLLGGLFLFFSFQIEPSHFRLVRASDKQVSISVDGRAIMAPTTVHTLWAAAFHVRDGTTLS
jgi:hypothetical protein